MTEETDRLFSRLERNRFTQGNDPNSVLDGQHTGIGSVNPTGFVSDLMQDGTGKVLNDGDGILVKDGSDDERVRLGHLGSGDYGLRITSPDGTTIIDGTSNVFKIAATGTFNMASLAGPGTDNASVTIDTGLTYRPATLTYLLTGGTDTQILPYIIWSHGSGLMVDNWETRTELVLTSQTKITGQVKTTRAAGLVSYPCRYYILAEIAF